MKTLPYIFLVLLIVSCTITPTEKEIENTITPEVNTIEAIQTHSTELFLNGYELLYDCFNCTPSYNDSVIVYAKKDTATKELFSYVLGDFYFGGITPLKHDGETFLLTTLNHTYGHSEGYLYHIDTTTFKITIIDTPHRKTTIPDSLEIWKEFGLQLEEGKLWDGASFRSQVNRDKYYLTITYDLQKTNNANYRLMIKNEQLIKEELE
jgi:hypothetical protein